VARGVVLPLLVLEGDVIELELAPLELDELAPDASLGVEVDDPDDESRDMPDAAPLDGLEVVAPVLLDPLDDGLVADGLLVDGLVRFTSPPDVPLVVLPCALPVDGVQGAVLTLPTGAEEVVAPDAPEVVLIPLVLAVVLAVVLADASVDGVVPVPLAPLVLFRPVKRWSGLVAVLFAAESDLVPLAPTVEPVVELVLGLIVEDEEYPVAPVLDELAPIRIGGHGLLPDAVCCAPADAANAAPRMRVTLAARHRTRWGHSMVVVRIVSSRLLPCWRPRGARGRVGRAVVGVSSRDRVSAPHDGDRRGRSVGAQCACPQRPTCGPPRSVRHVTRTHRAVVAPGPIEKGT
jgi:hypothetical protein